MQFSSFPEGRPGRRVRKIAVTLVKPLPCHGLLPSLPHPQVSFFLLILKCRKLRPGETCLFQATVGARSHTCRVLGQRMVLENTDEPAGSGEDRPPQDPAACLPSQPHISPGCMQSDGGQTALAPQPHAHGRPKAEPPLRAFYPTRSRQPGPAAAAPLASETHQLAAGHFSGPESRGYREGSERSAETFRIHTVKLVTQSPTLALSVSPDPPSGPV